MNNWEAYILAGGKSSRMGEDKGLKLLKGIPIIQYEIDVLATCFSTIKINTRNSEYKKFKLELIPDIVPDKGPMGGIYTSLKNSGKDIFIFGCDMPFITQPVITYLINNYKGAPITVAAYNSKVQPLFGIYTQQVLPLLEEKIKKQQFKMRDLLQEAQAEIIEMKSIANEEIFTNLNTSEEFEQMENRNNEND